MIIPYQFAEQELKTQEEQSRKRFQLPGEKINCNREKQNPSKMKNEFPK